MALQMTAQVCSLISGPSSNLGLTHFNPLVLLAYLPDKLLL